MTSVLGQRRRSAMRTIMLAFIVFQPATCAFQRDAAIEQGEPPAYAQGYRDGCESGRNAAGAPFTIFNKDLARYRDDPDYARGWNEGLNKCEWEETVPRPGRLGGPFRRY